MKWLSIPKEILEEIVSRLTFEEQLPIFPVAEIMTFADWMPLVVVTELNLTIQIIGPIRSSHSTCRHLGQQI